MAFVGEAPSDQELIMGRPFTGPAGKVFNHMMEAAGLNRFEFHITNVFNQQAPDNDVGAWMRDPKRAALARATLAEELAVVQPNIVVPMGATALWALTGQTAIGPFRGTLTKATLVSPGMKLLPTFHPSHIQRGNWKLLPIVVADMMKAERESHSPKLTYPKATLYIDPNESDVEGWVKECFQSDMLSIDIETGHLIGLEQITTIGIAPTPDRAMSIPFVDRRYKGMNYWPSAKAEHRIWQLLKPLFESNIPKLGQNFVYDVKWIWDQRGIAMMNYLHDTRLLHHARFPELPKTLEFITANYTNLGPWKMMGGKYKENKKDA